MKRLLPLLVFVALAIVLFAGVMRHKELRESGKDPNSLPSALIDKPAPEFNLPDVVDPARMVSRNELLGQPYLLNVWASWCFACRIEHQVVTQLADSGPVPVYGLNWKDDRDEANRWLRQFGNPYVASAFDESGRVGIDFGVYGAPETFLIDAEGRVRYKHVGPMNPEMIEKELLPAIREVMGGP